MKRIIVAVLIAGSMIAGLAVPAVAANIAITGGTNGPDCDSGGYFTPKTVTAQPGDTITISVPAHDPYAGGIEVHGFSEGNFVVLPGKSHTTRALTANVSYYGTWPSTGCMKGTGTITVASGTVPSAATTTQPATAATAPAQPAAAGSANPTDWLLAGVGAVVLLGIIIGVWAVVARRRA